VSTGRLAKRTQVREIERSLDIDPNVVRATDDLLTVARQAFRKPQTRVLAIVDEEGRLVGVVPAVRIVEEIVANAAPETLIAEISDLAGVERFGREVGAKVAMDLASPPIALQLDDTVGDAFRLMHEHHYTGLPVIDAERRVVGYVDLLELALRYLEPAERTGPPEPRS
jgi:CBS domain-containing protein